MLDYVFLLGKVGVIFNVLTSPFDVEVWTEFFNPTKRRLLSEYKNIVYYRKRREYLGALAGGDERARRTFIAAHRRVGVDAHNQHVAEFFGRSKIAYVAHV